VSTVDLPSDATIEECAMVLKNFLEKNMAGKKVNIIAHSLGGLDARYLASVLHSTQVASITTIGSPHRGTPLADWGLKQLTERGAWYYAFRFFGYDLVGRRFLRELTTEFMAKQFNPRVPDRMDIKYFSVVTTGEIFTRTMSPLLYATYYWVRSMRSPMAEEPNDGIVPESSQAWGKEIAHLQLDHLAQMGHDSFRVFSLEQESLKLYSLIYRELQSNGL
jgi:triacylglycerol lipase